MVAGIAVKWVALLDRLKVGRRDMLVRFIRLFLSGGVVWRAQSV
jgi:hypothetical protein